MKHIIFLTENVNKYKELEAYLGTIPSLKGVLTLDMIKPDYELHEIQSLNRGDIVRNKLENAIQHNSNLLRVQDSVDTWIMVEDTSLCIDKQGGLPGPFIKYYLQSLSLENIANTNWGSAAQSYVNLAIGRINECNQIIYKDFEGMVNGQIVACKGQNGFGFDPFFQPIGSNITNAQMTMEEKAGFNPRTRAFQQVRDYLLV